MLLLDIGNSRIKAAIARGDALEPIATVSHAGDAVAAIATLPDLDARAPVWWYDLTNRDGAIPRDDARDARARTPSALLPRRVL